MNANVVSHMTCVDWSNLAVQGAAIVTWALYVFELNSFSFELRYDVYTDFFAVGRLPQVRMNELAQLISKVAGCLYQGYQYDGRVPEYDRPP